MSLLAALRMAEAENDALRGERDELSLRVEELEGQELLLLQRLSELTSEKERILKSWRDQPLNDTPLCAVCRQVVEQPSDLTNLIWLSGGHVYCSTACRDQGMPWAA